MGPEPKPVLAKVWGLLEDSDGVYEDVVTGTVPKEMTQSKVETLFGGSI